MPTYVSINGGTQGNITSGANSAESMGNQWQSGHTDESRVFKFEEGATVPTDPASGQPTGSRVYKPSVVTKAIDKASPLLRQAMADGELLKIEIKEYRVSTAGQLEHYFTTTYTDAVITGIDKCTPEEGMGEEVLQPREAISFTARKIDWTHAKAGTSASDDWRAPKEG